MLKDKDEKCISLASSFQLFNLKKQKQNKQPDANQQILQLPSEPSSNSQPIVESIPEKNMCKNHINEEKLQTY